MRAERCTHESLEDWVTLRLALWPDVGEQEHRVDAVAVLDRADQAIAFLVRAPGLTPIAFAEATLRRDHVNGCTTSPVAFVEGVYVSPAWRKRGIARVLFRAIEDWAISVGCCELASDTLICNEISQQAHRKLGLEETERVVFFRKQLQPKQDGSSPPTGFDSPRTGATR
jgi:aminoglycoside 6'-N-acetyltransferase I